MKRTPSHRAGEKKSIKEPFVIIGHFQCVCPEGGMDKNLETLRRGLAQAAEANVRVLSLPECVLTGYYRSEADARKFSFAIDSPHMDKVLSITAMYDMTVLLGFNERRGERLYNTVAVVDKDKVVGHYSKMFLVMKYFTPGDELPVFEKDGLKFGIVICADGSYIEPCRILALKGAKAVFVPHHNFVDDPLDHCLHARRSHAARAVENGIFYIRGNNVVPRSDYGKLVNGVPYFGYGDSYILNPHGETVAGAGLHDETLMIYNLDINRYVHRADRASLSLMSAQRLLGMLQDVVTEESAKKPEPVREEEVAK